MRIALLALLLVGCSSPVYRPVETKIPVPVPCIDALPAKPHLLSDAELLKLNDYEFVLALGSDRVARRQYESELEALVIPCLSVKKPAPGEP